MSIFLNICLIIFCSVWNQLPRRTDSWWQDSGNKLVSLAHCVDVQRKVLLRRNPHFRPLRFNCCEYNYYFYFFLNSKLYAYLYDFKNQAHCVHGVPKDQITIVFGEHDRNFTEESDTEYRKIGTIIRHVGFNRANFHNDIALLRLERPMKFRRSIAPACLPIDLGIV